MIRLDDLLAANPDAEVHGPVFATRFEGFCFDSRIVQPGELFLAMKTARADGHDYLRAACLGGALGALCQRPVEDMAALGATCVLVPDTERAIQRWAVHVLRARDLPVVGITGSVGKTTTKEMIAQVLSGARRVFRNPANYSGRFGLPVALGGLREEDEIAVLEMATDQFGEIAMQAEIAPPEVAVVTRVAPAHLAAFRDVAAVAVEKGALVEALPRDGLAILNADDPRVAAMAERSAAPVLRCGRAGGGTALDLVAGEPEIGLDGTRMEVRVLRDVPGATGPTPREPIELRWPWLGKHFAFSAMAALAVGLRYGVSAEEVVARLAALPFVPGRLRPLPARDGATILDDSYNASPAAVLAALDLLAALPAETRVAVLGDMLELGEASEPEHRRVGRRAAEVLDLLVTSGGEAEWIADEARRAGMDPAAVVVTYRGEDAAAAIEPALAPGALVLAKGSAATRTEKVVEALMAQPERAGELLVRQDAAWQQIVVLRPDRPTWLEIDHGALADNTRLLAARAAPAGLMAVVKADAYGHGAVQVARTVRLHGVSRLGVACLPEGAALRAAGVDLPILVLGYTPAWQAREAVARDLAVTVFDPHTARAFAEAGVALARRATVHVKVDTGLHRVGLVPADVPAFLEALRDLPGLEVEGLYTHFAVADERGPGSEAATDEQIARFDALLADLEVRGLRPPIVHAANSAALLTRPESRYDLVRAGIALYGLQPSDEVREPALRPALSWKTQVGQVRELAPGEAVGYGLTWTAERPSRVATIPVGYADGFRRAPRRWAQVLVRGRPAPLVGRVSMDLAGIDVTGIPGVRQGDEVVLIGRQAGPDGREATITAEDVAGWLGTISYEVVSSILARVSRVS